MPPFDKYINGYGGTAGTNGQHCSIVTWADQDSLISRLARTLKVRALKVRATSG